MCGWTVGAEQSGDIFAPAIMLWSAGQQLAGLQQLLAAGSRAAGCRERGPSQVRVQGFFGFSTTLISSCSYTNIFVFRVVERLRNAGRQMQGHAPALDAELALDLLRQCSARPQLRLWQSASHTRCILAASSSCQSDGHVICAHRFPTRMPFTCNCLLAASRASRRSTLFCTIIADNGSLQFWLHPCKAC